jgi:hypothetical protein
MSLFSGLFRKKVMYHEELPSRERIVRVFEEHLVPVLEPRGFIFRPKDLEFRRDRGDLLDIIDHATTHHNSSAARIVDFRPSFTIRSKAYAVWGKAHVLKTHDGTLWHGDLEKWPGTDRYGFDHVYSLGTMDNERLIKGYIHNLSRHVVPFMDGLSTLERVMEHRRALGTDNGAGYVQLACMLGLRDEARRSLTLHEQDMAKYMDKPEVVERMDRTRKLVNELQAT